MASLGSTSIHHGRSLSLPNGSHPATSQFDENVSRIRTSEATFSSLLSFNEKLHILQNLYLIIDDFILSTHVTSQEFRINQVLDGYISLLDSCSSAKDLVSRTKHEVQELSSAIRRKDANGIRNYLTCRKKTKKMIEKSLKNLKITRSKIIAVEKNHESVFSVSMLKEAESVTILVLESLMSYMMGSKSQSLVSKLINSKKVGVEKELNEFEKTDSTLQISQIGELMNHLKAMDSNVQVLEEELESLFRQLIKTRVSLLNILNN